ncbi:chloride channel protein [Reinekea blandensis]|uniref:Chloride channel protein EriC n=1 Tax=Reinekea blandensis MED297 TaxID=314283 RepID=A4BAH0_9GAMM|nr:chloride channel protein [Reinekea blandensis]EAR10926.1 Chloride channel protein EriC [Reinekea sp. MED297] [Reinekea blandensis MED297]
MSQQFLSHWRSIVFQRNGLALLSVLGVATGLATSLVIVGFMLAIDLTTSALQAGQETGFEGFSPWVRLLLPLTGSVLLILLYRLTPTERQDVGITHVIDRLQRGRGRLPLGNTFFQFFAALITLTGGFSLGKEGPAVHVGSGIASRLGLAVHRSPSQLRLLTGCGTAAAISAAFGTPLAGVLFAMEVVLMEYSLTGFIPIIAAAVTATVSTQFIMGEHPVFLQVSFDSSADLPFVWLVVLGVATGAIAALMHKFIKQILALNIVNREWRFLTAGLITGLIGMALPQILGLGYGTMNSIAAGELGFMLLLAVLVGKIAATSVAVGFGIPAGIVAPSLVIGMATGALIGGLAPDQSNNAVFALVGMAGMMSALLHAPLAALTAVLELSLTAETMFPAMVVVVLSNLTCQVVFLQPSIFQTLLSNKGLNISTHPMRNALASRFLTEIATTQFVIINDQMDEEAIRDVAASNRRLVIFRLAKSSHLVTMNALQKRFEKWQGLENRDDINLFQYLANDLPDRSRIAVIQEDLSLLEGLRIFQSDDVVGIQVPLDEFRIGLITRSKLSSVLTTEGDLH